MIINVLVWGMVLSVVAGIIYRGFVDPKQPPSNQKATIALAEALKAAMSNHVKHNNDTPEVSGSTTSEDRAEDKKEDTKIEN